MTKDNLIQNSPPIVFRLDINNSRQKNLIKTNRSNDRTPNTKIVEITGINSDVVKQVAIKFNF